MLYKLFGHMSISAPCHGDVLVFSDIRVYLKKLSELVNYISYIVVEKLGCC